jgi:DNA-directed RNA polymerase subunit RPC12/RpoP
MCLSCLQAKEELSNTYHCTECASKILKVSSVKSDNEIIRILQTTGHFVKMTTTQPVEPV